MAAISTAGPTPRTKWSQALMAWWYGAPMLRRFKPLVRATFAEGDQVSEAKFLAEAGYHVASASLCRTAIETRIRRAAILSPAWHSVRKDWRAEWSSHFLFQQGLWTSEQHQRFQKLYSLLSKITHNGRVEPQRVWELLAKAESMMKELDAMVLATLRTN